MANDNLAKQMSSSWTWGGAPSTTIDSIFQQMAAQGQSFFQASGDSDAYTGNQMIDSASQTNAPVDSTNLTCVGGTTLTDERLRRFVVFRNRLELQSTAAHAERRFRRRHQHLLHDSLLADECEHGGQFRLDHLPQHPRRGADGGQCFCVLQQWRRQRRGLFHGHQLRRAVVGGVLRAGQPAVRRGERNDRWLFEPRPLRHRQQHELQRLFSRHHHRQQHRHRHAGTVLRRHRLRPLHRPRHAERDEPDQCPRAAAIRHTSSPSRPARP